MADTESVQTELASMRQELARAESDDPAVKGKLEAPPPCVSFAPELDSFLHEMQAKWSEASDNAEELVKAHPVAALAAAFLVGIALGRLTGRSS